MKYNVIIFLITSSFVLGVCSTNCAENTVYRDLIENRTLNFMQTAVNLGLSVEEFDVVTQDGYILKLFHIPGDKSRPIFLMHGIIDSADTFIIRGNTSLAVTLFNAGYDVWVGNYRGNKYSRRHLFLDPDVDVEFWDFSFHECGYYDLPAMIDFVLDKTGQDSLSALGHSQGNTIFYVLGATRPDYNMKIKVLIALSPVCYLHNVKNAVKLLMYSMPVIVQFSKIIGQEEFLGDGTAISRVLKAICGCEKNYGLCAYSVFFPIAGFDPKEMEPRFFPTVIAHYPTGTSVRNALHVSQVGLRRSFSEFDYEWRNIDVYNSSVPPEYDLSKVTMKIMLLAGMNDEISTIKDVNLLNKRLPNVVEYRILDYKKFNHIDAVWGRNMKTYLFPYILGVLSKYS